MDQNVKVRRFFAQKTTLQCFSTKKNLHHHFLDKNQLHIQK